MYIFKKMKCALLKLFVLISVLTSSVSNKEEIFMDRRIVGGTYTTDKQYSFMVSIQWKSMDHFCGGSMVTYKKVLTACHCICSFRTDPPFMFFPEEFRVVSGSYDLNSKNLKVHDVESTLRHPKCGLVTYIKGWTFDIALLRLKSNVNVPLGGGGAVSLMPLYSKDPIKVMSLLNKLVKNFTKCTTAGWGTDVTKDDFSHYGYSMSSTKLKSVSIKLLSIEECEAMLCQPPKEICLDKNEILHRNQWCAIGESKEDACVGDSGGPLLCLGYVLAVLSWGPACGELPYPSMYSIVDYFMDLEPLYGTGVNTSFALVMHFILQIILFY